MTIPFHRPRSLDEALALLADGEARPLAGGQTLVPMLNLDLLQPSAIVTLRHVPEVQGIQRLPDGSVRIGAMATHAALADSAHFTAGQAVIPDAARQIAHPAVRNFGTIGGACAHGDPAGDWPAALVAANAVFHAAGPGGARTIASGDFFEHFLTTALQPGELLTHIVVPPLPGRGLHRRQSRVDGDYATLSIACVATPGNLRVAIGSCGPRPLHSADADAAFSAGDVARGCALLLDLSDPIGDVRGSAAYRRRILPVLVRRTLAEAQA